MFFLNTAKITRWIKCPTKEIAQHTVRLTELLMDKNVCYSIAEAEHYAGVAKELSWIDREENGYFIMVPKTIEEFKFEGQQLSLIHI